MVISVTAWLGNNWGGKSGTLNKCFVTVGVSFLLADWEFPPDQQPPWEFLVLSVLELSLLVFNLFSGQLLVQFGDIVVPLCLVTGSCHRGSQVVFLPEALDLELATAVSRAVSEDGLRARQFARLLIDQPHVPVKT